MTIGFLNENMNLTFENISKPQLLFNDNNNYLESRSQQQKLSSQELQEKIKQAQNSIIQYNDVTFYQHLKNIQACFIFDFEKDQCKSMYIKTLLEFNRMIEQVFNFTLMFYIKLERIINVIEYLFEETGVICWDIHYNTYRSFYGFVCFLEISTIDQDYIIDCLSLRNEIGRLKNIFQNPQILKITLDLSEKMNWLFRDFGIVNIVNSIDLSLYLKELNLTSIISYLSTTLLNYPFSRILQTFDFRKRPLSLNEINYLRAFSYFPIRFLAILVNNIISLDKMRLYELFKLSQINSCLNLKNLENLLQDTLLQKHFEMFCFDKNYDTRQKYYLRKILKWRIQRAQLEDESVEYIFPAFVIQKFINVFPTSLQQVLEELKNYQQEISMDHYETFFSFFDERSFQNHKEMQLLKQNNSINDQQSIQQLIPKPTYMSSQQANQLPPMLHLQKEGSNQFNQLNTLSPPLSPTSLLKTIGWVSKNPREEGTPEKNFKELISRQNLSPSILKYSPQNGVDSPQHDNIMKDILCIINERNSKNSQAKFQESIRRELQRINNMADTNDNEDADQEQEDTFQMNLLNKLQSKQYYIKNSKENLPNNIEDIFELANRKRKKNKDKKRKRDEKSPTLVSQKETKEKEKLNVEQLLKDIKWI